MRYKKIKGEITVFLTLLFFSVSALILTVVESARAQAVRVQTERVMQTGIHSSFAEYNQDLLAYYDLLAIDPSYRTSGGSVENVRQHLEDYAEENFRSSDPDRQKSDWLKLYAEKTSILQYQLLSDGNGTVLIDQAVKSEQDRGQQAHRSDLLRASRSMRPTDEGAFMNDFARMLALAQDVEGNPAETVYETAGSTDLLNLVTGSTHPSGRIASGSPSRRSLKKGTYGSLPPEDGTHLFDGYLLRRFGNYLYPKDHAVMACEQEYLIAGKPAEKDSLRTCLRMILAQREDRNLNGLMHNGEALRETEELAMELCEGNGGDPYYTQMSLLYAWAYAEAAAELGRLLHGGKAPMEDYTTPLIVPLSGLEEFTAYCGTGGGSGEPYEDYLAGLLVNTGRKQKVLRCMDLIEQNIRHAGHDGFRVDTSITYFRAEMAVGSSYGHGCRIEREYGYLFP